jgi:cytochrome c553
MRAIAAGLSDQDMADLAAYYAAPPAQTAAK